MGRALSVLGIDAERAKQRVQFRASRHKNPSGNYAALIKCAHGIEVAIIGLVLAIPLEIESDAALYEVDLVTFDVALADELGISGFIVFVGFSARRATYEEISRDFRFQPAVGSQQVTKPLRYPGLVASGVFEIEAETAQEAVAVAFRQDGKLSWRQVGQDEFWNARFATLDENGGELPDAVITRG